MEYSEILRRLVKGLQESRENYKAEVMGKAIDIRDLDRLRGRFEQAGDILLLIEEKLKEKDDDE